MNISIKELRAKAQGASSPKRYSQTLWGRANRFFSIYATAIFVHLPFTPNQITILSVLVYFVGLALYIPHEHSTHVWGFVLVAVGTLLDAVDGEVYRFREMKTRAGGIFSEPVSHDIQYAYLFFPLVAGIVNAGGDPIWYLIAGFGCAAKLLFRLLEQRWLAVQNEMNARVGVSARGGTASQAPGHERFPLLYFIYRNLFTSTGILAPLLIATVFEKINWFVGFYSAAYALFFVALFFKKCLTLIKLIDKGAV